MFRHFVLWMVGLAVAHSSTSAGEREALTRYARHRRRIVEIGVWQGVNARRLRAVMAGDGVFCAVDPYPRGRLGVSFPRWIARREVARARNGAVRWMRLTGHEAARRFVDEGLGHPDFVFVDGDHSFDGLRRDWEAWSPLITPGGIVALHDSRATAEYPIGEAGSVRFTQAVILRDPRFEHVESVDRLTVLRRIHEDRREPGG